MSSDAKLDQVLALLQRQQDDIDFLKRIVVPLTVGAETAAQTARRLGVSPSTISRRRARLRAEATVARLHTFPRHVPAAAREAMPA